LYFLYFGVLAWNCLFTPTFGGYALWGKWRHQSS